MSVENLPLPLHLPYTTDSQTPGAQSLMTKDEP